jgi:hypothetical protein
MTNNLSMTHALLGDPSNSFQVPTYFQTIFNSLGHHKKNHAYTQIRTKITKKNRVGGKNHDVTIINTYLVVIYCNNNLKYNHTI